MVITSKEWEFIKSQEIGAHFRLLVDCGLREIEAVREQTAVILEGPLRLDLAQKVKGNFCYLVEGEEVIPLAFFSEVTNRFYKLAPTADWPTLCIGSTPMHKLASPARDTRAKIELIKPYGQVLDTCMGLGYTAILAAHTAKRVCTFDCIIHDPPTFPLAPQLYGVPFYEAMHRLLKPAGRLFHYFRAQHAIVREDFLNAQKHLNAALAIRTDDGCAHNDKALCFAERGRYAQALVWFNRGIRRDRDCATLYHNKGWLLNVLGKYSAAVVCFRKALELHTDRVESIYSLADTYQHQKKYGLAYDYFRRAQRLIYGKSSVVSRDIAQRLRIIKPFFENSK